MNFRRMGIPALLFAHSTALVLVFTVSAGLLQFALLRRHGDRVTGLVHRDSAAWIGSSVVGNIARGSSVSESLEKETEALKRLMPGSVLLVVDRNGRIVHSSEIARVILPFSFEDYEQILSCAECAVRLSDLPRTPREMKFPDGPFNPAWMKELRSVPIPIFALRKHARRLALSSCRVELVQAEKGGSSFCW